jgi:TatA/E family protein of Tat protein translocase
MTGIVLSGGESRRMGTDKAFLKIGGLPLIEHVIRALRSVAERIIIVSNFPEAYASYNAEIATDAFKKRGSLIGLYSGLLRSQDEYNIVVACDMPFLNSRLLSHMSGLAAGYDIIAPCHLSQRTHSRDRRSYKTRSAEDTGNFRGTPDTLCNGRRNKPLRSCTAVFYKSEYTWRVRGGNTNMFGLGMPELVVILIIVLVVFGASRLPQLGEGLGKAIKGFKKGLSSDDNKEEAGKKESKG